MNAMGDIMSRREYNELKSILLDTNEKVSKVYEKLIAEAGKELLTPNEICRMLKIGRSTYQRYVDTGVIKQVHIGNNNSRAYVKRTEIERMIDEGKI